MTEEQDIQTDQYGISIKKVPAVQTDQYGIPVKKKESVTISNTGGGQPKPISTPIPVTKPAPVSSGNTQLNLITPSVLSNGRTILDDDIDMQFSLNLSAPGQSKGISLSNLSSFDKNAGLLEMSPERQAEAKKIMIKNDPDALKEYRTKRAQEINQRKKEITESNQDLGSLDPLSGNQTGTLLDDVATAEINSINDYQVRLQKSIEQAAKVAVPKSFIEAKEPIDTRKVGQKYLETIGDPTVTDNALIMQQLDNNETIINPGSWTESPRFNQKDIDRTKQGIEYKLDREGSVVMSNFWLQQANEVAALAPDKVQAYNIAVSNKSKAKGPIEQREADAQLSVLLQDESIKAYQASLSQAEDFAKRYDNVADQYPQVKRAQLRQQLNDAFFEVQAEDNKYWDIWGSIFGRTPDSEDVMGIANRMNMTPDAVQRVIDEGGFFDNVSNPIRIPGLLQGVASGARETIDQIKMGLNRIKNIDDVQALNAVIQSELEDYNIKPKRSELKDDTGKWNINPYSIFNTMGSGIGQTTVYAAPTLLTGGLAAPGTIAGKIISAASTIGTGYAGSYESGYQEAARVTSDESVRRSYANITALENALPELIMSPADVIRKIAPKTNLQSFISGVAKDGVEKTTKSRLAAFGKEFGNVILAENIEEATTNITNNATKQEMLGIEMSGGDWLSQAIETAVQTTLTTLPLGIGAGMGGMRDASGIRKEALFEAGNEPELYKLKLQQLADQGRINQDDLNKRVQIVNTMSDIVAGMGEMRKLDGTEYSYEEKANIAAQQYRIRNNNEILKNNPVEGAKPVIEADNQEAINIQQKIIVGESPINTDQDENRQETPGQLANGGNQPAQAQADLSAEAVSGTNQANEQGQVSTTDANEPVSSDVSDDITISDVMGKPVIYNGQRGVMFQDGQAVVVKIDGQPREYELGNIDELSPQNIADFGIEHEQSVVSINENGNIEVRGEEYINDSEDPIRAIYKDDNGNLMHVRLKTKDGEDKLFGGAIGEDLAYQITLKEINKSDETRQQFEDFLNADEVSVDLGSIPETTQKETTGSTVEVQREKIKRPKKTKSKEPLPSTVKSEGSQQIVYHGGKIEGEFNPDRGDFGIHFGTKEQAENRLTTKSGGDVKAYTIDLKRPIDLSFDMGWWNDHDKWEELGYIPKGYDGNIISKLEEQGYDGIIYPNNVEGEGDSYIVFDKNAIKEVKNETTKDTKQAEVQLTPETEIAPTAEANADQQGAGTVPPTTDEGVNQGGEESVEGITQAAIANMRKRLGLPPYERTRTTKAALSTLADQIISEGYDITKLMDKIEGGNQPSPLETVILGKYKPILDAQVSADPSDENIRLAKRFSDVLDKSGSIVATAFMLRQYIPVTESSLSDFFVREMENTTVDVLTDAQKEQVTKEHTEITEAQVEADKAVTELESEAAKDKAQENVKKEKKSEPKQKKSKEEYRKDRDNIKQKIKDKLKRFRSGEEGLSAVPVPYFRELFAIAPDVAQLTRSYVAEGVDNFSDLVKNILGDVKDVIPDVTESDIVDLLAGQYNVNTRVKTEMAEKVKDFRDEARLLKKLDALLNGEQPKSESAKRTRNKALTDLRKQIDEIQKRNRREGNELTLQQRADLYNKQADKIEENIKNGVFSPEERPIPLSENIELKNRFPELYKKAIAARDRLTKAKKDREIRLAQEQRKERSKWQKVIDVITFPFKEVRTVKASFDLSAPLRQGIIPTISELIRNPKGAGQRMERMVKSAASAQYFDRWMDELRESDMWPVMKESGLAIADPNNITEKEEVFQSKLAEKIPYFGTIGIKGSERAYAYFLNSQRVDMFSKGVSLMQKKGMTMDNSKDAYKSWAKTVNALTGRGELIGPFKNSAGLLSIGFFSPRLIASRLSFFNPWFYSKIPAPLRWSVARDMVLFAGLGTTILGAISLLSGDDDDLSVEWDPRSPDFGKIRVGNTRYDIWGGFQQYLRLFSTLATQSKKTSDGKIVELQTKKGNQSGATIGTFFRSKAAPTVGSAINILTGTDVIGNKVTVQDEAIKFMMPLIFSDTYDALKEDGVSGLATTTLPAMFGVGVATYDTKKKK